MPESLAGPLDHFHVAAVERVQLVLRVLRATRALGALEAPRVVARHALLVLLQALVIDLQGKQGEVTRLISSAGRQWATSVKTTSTILNIRPP